MQDLTDEKEKEIAIVEEEGEDQGEDRVLEGEEEGKAINGKEKKTRTRRNLFVVPPGGAASKKMAQAILSPR